mmetsp:Transcript_42530/g.121654  ORF Transcript_42530/g.121654 Transcript_42530/m.121654 type:complete len:302 (+) Transcript_42530:331-1236(+)
MLASISAELLNGLAGCLRYLWNLPDEPLNRGGQLRPERSLEVRPTSPQQYGSCFALLDRRNLCTEDGLHDKLVDIGERRLICKRFGDAAEGIPEYLHSVPVLGRLGPLQRLLEQRQHPGRLGAAGGDAEHVHHDVLLRLAELPKRGGVLGVRRIPSAEPRQRGHTGRAELPEQSPEGAGWQLVVAVGVLQDGPKLEDALRDVRMDQETRSQKSKHDVGGSALDPQNLGVRLHQRRGHARPQREARRVGALEGRGRALGHALDVRQEATYRPDHSSQEAFQARSRPRRLLAAGARVERKGAR